MERRSRVAIWVLASCGGCLALLVVAVALLVFLAASMEDSIFRDEQTVELVSARCASGTSLSLERTTTTNHLEGVEFSHTVIRYESAGLSGGRDVDTSLEYHAELARALFPPHVHGGPDSTAAVHVFLSPTVVTGADRAALEQCLVEHAPEIGRAVDAVEPSGNMAGRGVVVWTASTSEEISLTLSAPGQPDWRVDPLGRIMTALEWEMLGTIERADDAWLVRAADPRVTDAALTERRTFDGRTLRDLLPGVTVAPVAQ